MVRCCRSFSDLVPCYVFIKFVSFHTTCAGTASVWHVVQVAYLSGAIQVPLASQLKPRIWRIHVFWIRRLTWSLEDQVIPAFTGHRSVIWPPWKPSNSSDGFWYHIRRYEGCSETNEFCCRKWHQSQWFMHPLVIVFRVDTKSFRERRVFARLCTGGL